jgi:hypothetical protein
MNIYSDLWRYAESTYHEPIGLPFVPPSDRIKFYRWQDDTDYVMASVERDRVVIAHRGTDSAEFNIRGWISDLRGLDKIHDDPDPGVHNGFGEYGRKWQDDIAGIIRDAQKAGKQTILTGHSRGSAAAGARCVFLARLGIYVSSVIGFGSPNWCDKEVRNEVNALPTDYINVNCTHDIVQHIPPEIMVRPGKEITIATKYWIPFPPLPPLMFARGVRDHLPSTYRHQLLD